MKNIFRILILSSLAAFALSCQEWNEEKPKIDEPAVLYLISEGISEEIVVLEPNSKAFKVKVGAESISDQNLEISLAVNPDLVAEYNAAHGTDYPLLSADAYEIPDVPMYLPRYNKVSSVMDVKLKTETLTDERTYLLPLTIGAVEGTDNYKISEDSRDAFVLFRMKAVPKPVQLAKDDWKVLYCSSWRKDSGKGAHPQNTLFDDDVTTYWTYNSAVTPPLPIYIVIDLGTEKTLRGLTFTSRIKTDGKTPWGPPARGKIHYSNSLSDLPAEADDLYDINLVKGMTEADWTEAEDFYFKTGLVSTMEFENPHNARYVRITVEKAHNNGSDENYKGLQLAGLDFSGHETPLDLEEYL